MARTLRGTVRAPEFPPDLQWLNTDQPLTLSQLRGKVVLLDFWTYCCINCMHILPELKQIEDKWHDDLIVIGVHSAKFTGEGDTENIRQAILRYEIEHPVINDAGFNVWREYAVRAWPTIAIIDPEGKLVAVQPGETTFERLDPVVSQLVATARADGTLKPSALNLTLERDKAPRTLLAFPGKVLADPEGERLFIADSTHHRYLVCSLDGKVQQIIGSGVEGFADGAFTEAQFRKPQGMALDGDRLYLADTENHAVRVADLRAKTVTTLAGNGHKPTGYNRTGSGREVALHSPWALAIVDRLLYVAMAGSHQLWTISLKNGDALPFAGSAMEDIVDGPRYSGGSRRGTAALAQPSGLAPAGDRLYFVDSETSSVRYVTLGANGQVKTLIGQGLFEFGDIDGDRSTARLQHPLGIAYVDGVLYLADTYNNKLKRLDPADGRVETFAGTGEGSAKDGPALQATFDEPGGLSYANGKLYVADTNNSAVRVVDLETKQVRTLDLKNPEMARPPHRPRQAPATKLPPVTVAPGQARIELKITCPEGLHLNPEAPVTVTLEAEPAGVATRPEQPVSAPAGQPEISIPLTLQAGTTTLTLSIDSYLCTTTGSGACYFDATRYALPVTVEDDATEHTIRIEHRVMTRR